MDTYRGCTFNCSYCFARDFVTFSRRNSENKSFMYLEGNRPDRFRKWCEKVMKEEYNYEKGETVAFKERIPLKIGATSDPFPHIEKEERITFETLKILGEYDYPTQMSTKNPKVLLSYLGELGKLNLTLNVTMTSADDKLRECIEPLAPTTQDRFDAIKGLTSNGVKVLIRMQPFIYPFMMESLEEFVSKVKDSGAWGFMTEALKVRISMPKEEQKIMQRIGDFYGVDIREVYRKEEKTGSDWEYSKEKKMIYIKKCEELANKYGLRYFVGDNDMGKCGDGAECCGTEVLKNYKILKNSRTLPFDIPNHCYSQKLENVLVNFCRSTKYKGKTIKESMGEGKHTIIDPTYSGEPRIYNDLSPALRSERTGLLLHTSFQGGVRQYDKISPTITTPSGGGHLPYVKIANTLDCQQAEVRPVLTPDRKEKRQNGRRMKENGEDSFTLTSQDKHGVAINKRIRRLTPCECARLQGFPDDWCKDVSDSQQYRCYGNAVTVDIVQMIATRLKQGGIDG